MARTRKRGEAGYNKSWLVTFADLMTLLFVFFVLLLSMSTMNSTDLARISNFTGGVSFLDDGESGRVPERIELVVKALKEPENMLHKPNRIKDLLFPVDVLPKEVSRSTLEENLKVLAHPEGVVIVLTEGLLFDEGGYRLDGPGGKLIDILTPVILRVNADVNISGHTDASPAEAAGRYDLSALRALSVLERFLYGGIGADRFSISGYGADRPMYPNDTAEHRRQNRRVEILLKTAPRLAGY